MKLPFNKNTTRMIGLISCLSVSFMGCSSFAGYAALSSGVSSGSTILQEGNQRDLADF